MPDLGAYAGVVTLAYAGSLALLAAIIGLSVVQANRSKRRLAETEARQNDA